ncbi:unnamed protein product [Didymodactylos carnosus]|uniref:Mitochondrial GTPase 1 n=1 Tax=Didymodactylos carnosus TaxID=1234261 RepID=A0A814UD96_9BILA|nr:unnamed protein product [Didymodactylos carnosus]CAF1170662.1 unnamed protein product [Didymodactylos carnosus]CAF3769218.1 unnamed protein product [Didymodactylos carnosus]CAF3934398.1 unnamed protein product [Didymodactylos carnosus]
MASKIGRLPSTFDFQSFRWKDVVRWFPGHMTKGMRDLEETLIKVDGIIEVHDARIPHSGRNPNFYKRLVGGHKPHLLLLNKADLADKQYHQKSIDYIKQEHPNVEVSLTSFESITAQELSKLFVNLIEQIVEVPRFTRQLNAEYQIIVCGIPNVGKSTLINRLRNMLLSKPKVAQVGALPGVTRSMSERIKICEKPKIYIRDSPGILEPKLKSPDESFRLLLTNCIPLQQTTYSDLAADYLLYLLNKYEKYQYVEYCGLSEPTTNIIKLLTEVAQNKHFTKTYKGYKLVFDLEQAARHFLLEFSKGTLGIYEQFVVIFSFLSSS